MSERTTEAIESDYLNTPFEGISEILNSHPHVSSFLISKTSKRPDDFRTIREDLFDDRYTTFEEQVFADDILTIPDVFNYLLDLIEFFKTNLEATITEDGNEWEQFEEILESVSEESPLHTIVNRNIKNSFDSPIELFEIKSRAFQQLIKVLSYEGNEPEVGDYFIYEAGNNQKICGQITQSIDPDKDIVDGLFYKYDLLVYHRSLSDHTLVLESDSTLIQPRHSQCLTLYETNPIFEE